MNVEKPRAVDEVEVEVADDVVEEEGVEDGETDTAESV